MVSSRVPFSFLKLLPRLLVRDQAGQDPSCQFSFVTAIGT